MEEDEPRMSVEDTVNWLYEARFPKWKYEELQEHRKERLRLWEERGIEVIAKEERRLIEFGEQVLSRLTAMYNEEL